MGKTASSCVDLTLNCRSSCPDVFCQTDVLENLAKFTGKHLCRSLFLNKVLGQDLKLYQKRLPQVFSCEFCEISKITFLQNTSGQLLLKSAVTSIWDKVSTNGPSKICGR